MVEKIIEQLNGHSNGPEAIAKMAKHTVAECHIAAREHLAYHIKTRHGGNVDHFLYTMRTDDQVLTGAVVHYGRRQLGFE